MVEAKVVDGKIELTVTRKEMLTKEQVQLNLLRVNSAAEGLAGKKKELEEMLVLLAASEKAEA